MKIVPFAVILMCQAYLYTATDDGGLMVKVMAGALDPPMEVCLSSPDYEALERPIAHKGLELVAFREGWSIKIVHKLGDGIPVLAMGEGVVSQEIFDYTMTWFALEDSMGGADEYDEEVRLTVRDAIIGENKRTLAVDDVLELYPDWDSMFDALTNMVYTDREFNRLSFRVFRGDHESQRQAVLYWFCHRMFWGRIPTKIRKNGLTAYIATDHRDAAVTDPNAETPFRSRVYVIPGAKGKEASKGKPVAMVISKTVSGTLNADQVQKHMKDVQRVACDVVACLKIKGG